MDIGTRDGSARPHTIHLDQLLRQLRQHTPISRNPTQQFEESLTLGQRVADRIAAFGGSWTFILCFLAVVAGWMALNTYVLVRPFDSYPFILLNLVLSTIAAFQAPIIMMSQNRQTEKDRQVAAHDYDINLKAELEIVSLHTKLDSLRDQQWAALVALQHEQIALLTRLLDEAPPPTDIPDSNRS